MKNKCLQNILLLLVSLFVFWSIGEAVSRAIGVTDKLLGYDHNIFKKDENELLSYGFRPNYEGFVAESAFKINSHGFRDYEYDKKKGDGIYRIAVLGDSVTAGMGIDLDKAYPKVLEELLNKKNKRYEVLNFGINGYNLNQEVELYRSKVYDFEPNMVILGFNLNDVREAYIINKYGYLEKKESYNDYAFPWSLILPVESFLVKKSHFLCFIKKVLTDFLKSIKVGSNFLNFGQAQLEPENVYYIGEKNQYWEGTKKKFIELKNMTEEDGVKLVIVVLPFGNQLYEDVPDPQPQASINEFLKNNGIAYLDLLDGFKENRDKKLFRPGDYNHLSDEGHATVASLLCGRITQ